MTNGGPTRVGVVVTAAGSGTRLGRELPKALVPLLGTPLVTHAVRGVLASGVVDEVVVTAPRGHEACVRDALTLLDDGSGHRVPVRCVPGGATRQASVAAGLAELSPDVDVVLVHDAARSLTPPEVVRRVVDAVRAGARAVVPVLPVTDSVVEVVEASETPRPGEPDASAHHGTGSRLRPVDRSRLRAVQTPQGFDRALLDRAHAAARAGAGDERTAATDDASLCAALGEPVTAVDGHEDALKVTTSRDLAVAAVVLRERRPAPAVSSPTGTPASTQASPASDA